MLSLQNFLSSLAHVRGDCFIAFDLFHVLLIWLWIRIRVHLLLFFFSYQFPHQCWWFD